MATIRSVGLSAVANGPCTNSVAAWHRAPLLPRTAARLAEAGAATAAEIVADEMAALRGAAPWQVHAVAVRRALAQLAAPGGATLEHLAGPVAGTA